MHSAQLVNGSSFAFAHDGWHSRKSAFTGNVPDATCVGSKSQSHSEFMKAGHDLNLKYYDVAISTSCRRAYAEAPREREGAG